MVDALSRREPDVLPRTASRGVAPRGARDSFLGRMAVGLGRAWVRRQAINGLTRLDDRLLRDIGLERDGIPDAVDAMLRKEPLPVPAPRATVHRIVVEKAEDGRYHRPPNLAAA